MALDDLGTASGLARMLCACCCLETLHSYNRCVQCGTVIVFPAEQRKVKLSREARRLLNAMGNKVGRPRKQAV
jgi:hypothetical protein